ncbi:MULTISPECIES: hypothetical protein [unclassified Marivivens]|jgi:hypothetical protein|uniref:hypothetical protein n=1 Tax=unclassified Marivivens TaxID=2622455 RepID=UPI0008024D24|nr:MULTISPECIES: hypothetical protein [unclassified Marivivens]OBR36931.1 hypothetical protein A9199_06185 [Donghicola sp. JL3646]APO85980.1 hypothetical protein BSK21_02360 [Marivivens sp. JLT3646]NBQ49493.1 hypothetical protein [Marivivens sp.]NBT51619.1 hypothetical protein [Marivivens sp.]NBX08814.1 hypothetical protein [Marivivens sp.]
MAFVAFIAGSFIGLLAACAGLVFLNMSLMASFALYMIAGIAIPLVWLATDHAERRLNTTL